jgi:hypothetical protein
VMKDEAKDTVSCARASAALPVGLVPRFAPSTRRWLRAAAQGFDGAAHAHTAGAQRELTCETQGQRSCCKLVGRGRCLGCGPTLRQHGEYHQCITQESSP